MISKSWFSNGKLLITGEYLVLEGAKALSLPLKVGQYLSVKRSKNDTLLWHAIKIEGLWFSAEFSLPELDVINSTDEVLGEKLHEILLKAKKLNPDFLTQENGYLVETVLEFDPEHGFGSSSTLFANIARWANIDPYELQKMTFGGSGFDIASATARKPIVYQRVNDKPVVVPVNFNPVFKEHLYFVYLKQKQVSEKSIVNFRQNAVFTIKDIQRISRITERIVETDDFFEFESLLNEHESMMSNILKLPTAKSLHFSDFNGAVKSLGAWGGDFVLMTFKGSTQEFEKYLDHKSFDHYQRYVDIVLSFK